jgi:HlyD family secretion protein
MSEALDDLLGDSSNDSDLPETNARSGKWKKPVALLVALGVLGGGWAGWAKFKKASPAGLKQYKLGQASVGRVKKTVSASGTLQPWSIVDIKSRAGGRVEQLLVDVGAVVKSGQVLARIDPSDSQMSVQQAQADIDSAQARERQGQYQYQLQVRQSQIAIQTANAQVAQSRAQVASARANLKAAQTRLSTAQQQSEAQPGLTRSAIASAQASLKQAEQTREQLRVTTEQQKIAAKATYDQAVANRDNAKLQVKRQNSLLDQGFVSQQAVDTATAQLEVNESQVISAKARVDSIVADLAAQASSAEARVAQSRAALDQAKTQSVEIANRKNAALEQESAVQQQKAAVQQAEASLQQVQAALSRAYADQQNNQVRFQDIASAKASQARAGAGFRNASIALDQTTVRALTDGIVLKKYVEKGTIITSGMSMAAGGGTSIVQMGDISKMFVDVTVDETDIANVEEGQAVEVSIDAYPGVPFEGKVARVDPQAVIEQNVTTVHVRVVVDNSDAKFKLIKPGMNATCEFVMGSEDGVVNIPSEALHEDTEGKYVTTASGGKVAPVEEGGTPDPDTKINVKATRVAVEVGLTGNESVQITKGLKGDETIVLQEIEPEVAAPPGAAGGSPFGGRGMGGGFGRR